MATKKTKFPRELLVYVFDYEDGKPLFNVAEKIDDIPEDTAGEQVAVYTLNHAYKFAVKRELK